MTRGKRTSIVLSVATAAALVASALSDADGQGAATSTPDYQGTGVIVGLHPPGDRHAGAPRR